MLTSAAQNSSLPHTGSKNLRNLVCSHLAHSPELCLPHTIFFQFQTCTCHCAPENHYKLMQSISLLVAISLEAHNTWCHSLILPKLHLLPSIFGQVGIFYLVNQLLCRCTSKKWKDAISIFNQHFSCHWIRQFGIFFPLLKITVPKR